jgi:hypothetical protein
MKKFLIILVAVAILIPAAVHAFSLIDVFNLGKKIIQPKAQPTQTQVKNDLSAEATQLSNLSAEDKFADWESAYLKRDVAGVLADDRNLYFTESQINYLIAQELASATDPFAKDVTVSFSDNLIKVSGYSLIKNFLGQFYLEGKIVTVGPRINIQVIKARYHNFYFPSFLAQILLRNELIPMIDFLYSDPDHQTLTVTVGSGFIQLNYGNQ